MQKNKQEKANKLDKAREKEEKEMKAQRVRMEWMEKKNYETMLQKKMEKQKIRDEKMEKEENERKVQDKSVATYNRWLKDKLGEEKQKKRSEKEKERHEEEEKRMKAEIAEQKFKEWRKAAAKRPKSAPHSFGFMDGKLKGREFVYIFVSLVQNPSSVREHSFDFYVGAGLWCGEFV